MASPINVRTLAAAGIVVALAALPLIATMIAQPFYVTLFTRIMIFGLAALGLNLILGWGGMVSFGHAMYMGIGAYAVGILSYHGIGSGWAHLLAALVVGALVALLVGSVSLRTRGMAFIMITLAFAQMFFFLAVSLKQYGGDDGLSIAARSDLGGLKLDNPLVLYYLVYALLIAALYGAWRLTRSRFGMVIRGIKANERRMIALGVPTLRYRMTAYVISALVCVLAGVLLANLTRFVAPAYMQWQVSGELIVMAVLGGMGTLLGPVVGAAALLCIEEVLSSFDKPLPWGLTGFIHDHWMALLGLFIVAVVLLLKQGLYGWLVARTRQA